MAFGDPRMLWIVDPVECVILVGDIVGRRKNYCIFLIPLLFFLLDLFFSFFLQFSHMWSIVFNASLRRYNIRYSDRW